MPKAWGKFEFTPGEPVCYSDDDLYALENGYAEDAVNRLEDPDLAAAVFAAADLLSAFFTAARDQGVIGEM